MKKVAIVTDSSSDLEQSYISSMSIEIVPSVVTYNLTEYLDDGSWNVDDMFRAMQERKTVATTAPQGVEVYRAFYRKLLNEADHIISLHSSSQISMHMAHAQQAAEEFGGLITVLDSRTAAASLGMQVIQLAEGRAAGKSLQELVTMQKRLAKTCLLSIMVEDLQFLRMNGRINAATAMIGGVLGLKPILALREGKIEAVGRALGHTRALGVLAKTVRQYQQLHIDIRLGLMYAPGAEHSIDELRNLLANVAYEDAGNWKMGAAVAANTGPGSIGVALEPI